MNSVFFHISGFLLCTAVIVVSGTRLARHGDAIAKLTGWGKAWVGLILMASVTSLPELMTGISSVAIIGAPNLAAGDVYGSCVFNLLILAIVDARIKKPLTSIVKTSHLFAGLLGMILIALSGLAMLTSGFIPVLLWISPFTIVLILVYLAAVRGLYLFEHRDDPSNDIDEPSQPSEKAKLKKVFKSYVINALMVIGAAVFLPFFGEHLAEVSGLGNSLFGTLFLAGSTSLPELVVSFAAIRLGAFDMLVGGLLGSNLFNIFILALDDIFYTQGSLFAAIEKNHMESVVMVLIMTAVVGLGLILKPDRKYWRFSFDAWIIVLLYIVLMILLYIQS